MKPILFNISPIEIHSYPVCMLSAYSPLVRRTGLGTVAMHRRCAWVWLAALPVAEENKLRL